jgi:hypothetical protein
VSPDGNRRWSNLSAGSKRRWVAAYGGRGNPEQRAARAGAAYERGEQLTPEQRGHEPTEVRESRSISGLVGYDARIVEFSGLDRGEVRRVARYNSLVGQLARGRITGDEFERRAGGLQPLAGQLFSADPAAVLQRLEELEAEDVEVFHYESGRAA